MFPTYINKKGRAALCSSFLFSTLWSSTLDLQPSCYSTPLPSVTVALCALLRWCSHWHSITPSFCVFFLCPFLPPFVCFPTPPTPLPFELPPLPPSPPRGVLRDMHAEIISSIKNLQLDGEDPRKLLQSWGRLRFPRHVLQWVRNRRCQPLQIRPGCLSQAELYLMGMFHPVVVSAALSYLTWKNPLISLGYFKSPRRVTLFLMIKKKEFHSYQQTLRRYCLHFWRWHAETTSNNCSMTVDGRLGRHATRLGASCIKIKKNSDRGVYAACQKKCTWCPVAEC